MKHYQNGNGFYPRIIKSARRLGAVTVLSALLIGCGGSSSSDPGEGGGIIGTGYSGTASTERSLASNTVEIRSRSGTRVSAAIDGNGNFQASTDTDDSGPFLSRIDLGNGDYLYGIGYKNSQGDVQHNIHDYSNLVIRNWFSVTGEDIDSAFNSANEITLPTQAEISTILATLVTMLNLVLADYGVNGNDLLTAAFTANDTGIDAFLDQNPVLINNGTVNIIINQSGSNVQTPAVTDLPLDTDLAQADTLAPSIPADVRALAGSASEIIVVWSPSSDNVGVSAYRIFRDGVDIGETPYPVFSDTGLATGTTFNYTVVAVDSAGNVSAESLPASAQTSGQVDTTPPSAPLALASSNVTNGSIGLNWQHADVSDVASFELLGGPAGAMALIAVTSATFATDAGLEAGTEYCYSVTAIDAAGNKSAPSDVLCATSTGAAVTPVVPSSNVLSFNASTLQVLESSGKVTITVDRNGSAGEVSVDYTISEGTAISGQDYIASNGTLTWSDGETTSRSFDIQIATDTETEADETFSVTLSNPVNATLGSNTVTTVTISDSAPLACDNEPESLVIDSDTVMSLPCYTVSGRIDVRSPANLRIQPGVELRFASGGGMIVRSGGSLTAVGTAGQGILLTGVEKSAGFWTGVNFLASNSNQNQLEYVTIEYGGTSQNGGANLTADDSSISISNTVLRFSQGYGFDFGDNVQLVSFVNNTVTSNGIAGVSTAEVASGIAAQNNLSGNTTDRLEITSDPVDQATDWADINIPWFVASLDVRAAMSIAAGNELRFDSDARVIVRETGSLAAKGTVAEPILLSGSSEVPGWWQGIYFLNSPSIDNELSNTTIAFAGAGTNNANLRVGGNSRFKADNLTLSGGQGHGFVLDRTANVSQFSNISSTGNQSPGKVSVNQAGSIGAGSSFSGNSSDFLSVDSDDLDQTQTWLKHDVPYLLAELDLFSDLTLSPGTALVVQQNGLIRVRDTGSLNAAGTMAEPIIFTGEVAIAGSWGGIEYLNSTSPLNVLDYTVVEYGGAGNTDGNVAANCNSAALPAVTISNSNLDNSAGWGIYITGNCSVDIGDGVTFMNNAAGEVNVLAP